MFYSLNGELIHIEQGMCAIECCGVAYKCFVTINTQRKLPKVGGKVKLFTYLSVKEDAMDLFGFYSQGELNCFKILTSVSGVGVKMGLSILSEFSPEQIAAIIVSEDSKTLTRASGVGNKLAQRIILELKDKLKNVSSQSSVSMNIGVVSASNNISQAITALIVLGYSSAEATSMVNKFDASLSVEELIRLSLKSMAGRE